MATLTGNSRRRERQVQQLMAGRIEAIYARKLSGEIARAMREAASDITKGNRPNIEGRHKQRISAIMHGLWRESGRTFAEHILGRVQRSSRGPARVKRVEPTQIMDGAMHGWIAAHGTEKITRITATTQEAVRQAIGHGIREGLGEREIGKLVREQAPTKSASRAQTIARTETHAASQASVQASAEAMGVDMARVWLSASGARTRDDHAEADGQTVGMHEPFVVGGEQLMYPGDPAGSAANVINCRCVIAMEPVG